jgi:hypothetical protein
MQRRSAVPALYFLIFAFPGDNPSRLFTMAAKTIVTQRLFLVLRAMRQERQRPFCTSVYREAIFDLLLQTLGAEDECQPPRGLTRLPSAAGCTVSLYKPIEVPAREHSSQIKFVDPGLG